MSRTYIYVSEQDAQGVEVFRLAEETGRLEKVQMAAAGGKAMPIAITPDRRFLFVALRDLPYRIARFSIDPASGMLELLDHIPAKDSTVYMQVDALGRHLLGACNPPNRARRTGIVTLYPIGPDGALQPCTVAIRTPPKLHSIIPDPANRFVLAASCDGDLIQRYAFDPQSGNLSADGLQPVLMLPRSGPRHMRFHPNGRFIYVVNEYEGSVYGYRYEPSSGALMEIQIVDAVPSGYAGTNPEAADLHFTPDGAFLYVSVRETATLACFKVDTLTGLLELAGHFDTAKEPRSFCIDQSGRYLISLGMMSNRIVVHAIDPPTGRLSISAQYDTGGGPNWVEALTFA